MIDSILTKRELSLIDQARLKYGSVVIHGFTEIKQVMYAWVSHVLKDENNHVLGLRPTTGLVKENVCQECNVAEFYCNCNNISK